MTSAHLQPLRMAHLLLAARELAEFDESKHPRDMGGRFTHGDQVELTDDHWNAIADYILDPHLNFSLRGETSFSEEERESLKKIDEVIASQPFVQEGSQFYRSVSGEDLDRITQGAGLTVNPGFTPVSKSIEAIERGILENNEEGSTWALMKVEVGEGVRGFDVNKSEEFGNFNSFETQEEVILDRDITVEVVGRDEPQEIDLITSTMTLPVIKVRVSKKLRTSAAHPETHLHKVADSFVPRSLGGRGSGNFGHAGRPGEVGGSVADGSNRTTTPRLTTSEVSSLRDFRFKMGSIDLNRSLRGQTGRMNESRKPSELVAMRNNLDSAIAKSTVTKDTVVYRGVSSVPGLDDLKIGQEFTDKGYTSTSSDRKVAESFGRYGKVLEITVPKGSNLLNARVGRAPAGYGNEREMLLPRGTTFVKTGESERRIQLRVKV